MAEVQKIRTGGRQARKSTKKKYKQGRSQGFEKFVEEVEENFKENRKGFWNTAKGLRQGERKTMRSIKNREGKLITENQKILKVWKEHYSEKYVCHPYH